MAKCDNRGVTTRKQDWSRWLNALIGRYLPTEKRRHRNPVLNYLHIAWHTFANIVVEELRRWGIEPRPKSCD
jgi:hypothetical protein